MNENLPTSCDGYELDEMYEMRRKKQWQNDEEGISMCNARIIYAVRGVHIVYMQKIATKTHKHSLFQL